MSLGSFCGVLSKACCHQPQGYLLLQQSRQQATRPASKPSRSMECLFRSLALLLPLLAIAHAKTYQTSYRFDNSTVIHHRLLRTSSKGQSSPADWKAVGRYVLINNPKLGKSTQAVQHDMTCGLTQCVVSGPHQATEQPTLRHSLSPSAGCTDALTHTKLQFTFSDLVAKAIQHVCPLHV